MKIIEEECDESIYWIELLVESTQVKESLVTDLHKEAKEILAMIIASIKTARRNK